MNRNMAAPVYFALYCAIALLPLHMAMVADPLPQSRGLRLEFAVALGFIAFSLLLLEFALVTRLRRLSDAFGTDTLLQFHRALAIAGTAFLLGHVSLLLLLGTGWRALNPFAGSAALQTGAVSFWALLVLVASSLWRRHLGMSYDFWNWIHRLSAMLLLVAATAHIVLIRGYTAAPAVRYIVLALAGLFAAIFCNYLLLRPLRLWRHPWYLDDNTDIGGDTRLLTLSPVGHPGFHFEPGQFAWLISGRSPFSRQQHPITIASSAEYPATSHSLSFAIKQLGDWSRLQVPALKSGARLWIEGPYGAMSIDRLPAQGFVLIAGGIGITPMRATLLTMRDRGDQRPCILFYAANDLTRVVFLDELKALQAEIALRLVLVLEHPGPGYGGERGRIDKAILKRHLPTFRHHYQYLICGPNPMMDSIEHLLAELGIADNHIHSERFNQV
jgi:predicted ferric reductase